MILFIPIASARFDVLFARASECHGTDFAFAINAIAVAISATNKSSPRPASATATADSAAPIHSPVLSEKINVSSLMILLLSPLLLPYT